MGRRELVATVIFDVDGVLAETEEFHRQAFNRAFADFGLGWVWDVALYRDLLKVTGGKERIFITPSAIRGLPPITPGPSSPNCIGARRRSIRHGDRGRVVLRPGVGDFLEDAFSRGVELAIATTTSAPNVAALLGVALGAGWRKIFPVVAAGDMVQRKKPAPDVYRLAMERFRRGPSRCVASRIRAMACDRPARRGCG